MHLVGLPPLPLGLGRARGVEVLLGSCLAWAGLASSSPLPSGGGGVEVARSRQTSLSRVSESVDSPSFSPHVPRRENVRESSGSCSPPLYPPAIHALRCVNRGRIRGLGLERVALVDVAVSLALAPLPVRGQEVESVRGGHRPRHARLVVAHVESGRGLLTAIALGVEALGPDPRIGIGHAVTALGLLPVSVRVPLLVGGGGAIVRDRTLPRVAPLTARGLWSDCLLLLLARVKMEQHDGPDEESRRVWRRLPLSLLWFLEGRGDVTPVAGGTSMTALPSAMKELARFFLNLSGSSSLGASGDSAGSDRFRSGVGGSCGSLFVRFWSGHDLWYGGAACGSWRFA